MFYCKKYLYFDPVNKGDFLIRLLHFPSSIRGINVVMLKGAGGGGGRVKMTPKRWGKCRGDHAGLVCFYTVVGKQLFKI